MSYYTNVPQANEIVSLAVQKLRRNSQTIDSVFRVDHTTLDTAVAEYGKHKIGRFKEQASDATTAADEHGVYSKDNGSGRTDLYAREQSSGDVYKLIEKRFVHANLNLEAFVLFDRNANVIGESLNIDTIAQPDTAKAEYNINFDTAISNANYFWTINFFVNKDNEVPVISMPKNGASYASSVTTSQLKMGLYAGPANVITVTPIVPANINRIQVQIYTVSI